MASVEQKQIIDYMLDVCGERLKGYPRGDYFPLKDPNKDFVENYWFQDVGPSWAYNEPIVLTLDRLERLKKEGMHCIGLISVLLRCVLKRGKKMPSLDPDNYGKFKALKKGEDTGNGKRKYNYYEQKVDPKWAGKCTDCYEKSVAFGLNDTMEWLYIYTYGGKKGKTQRFERTKRYPRGTLLFRCYDPYTQGHVAMLYTDNKKYEDAKVFHTIGGSVGANEVAIEPLSHSHEYFSRGKTWDWDEDNRFSAKFYTEDGNPMPFYTHVLLPQDYIDVDVFGVPRDDDNKVAAPTVQKLIL